MIVLDLLKLTIEFLMIVSIIGFIIFEIRLGFAGGLGFDSALVGGEGVNGVGI